MDDRLSAVPEDSSIIPTPQATVPFDPASESLIIRPSPCFHKGENNCFQPRQRTLCTDLGPAPQEPPGGGRTTPPRARRRGDEAGPCRGKATEAPAKRGGDGQRPLVRSYAPLKEHAQAQRRGAPCRIALALNPRCTWSYRVQEHPQLHSETCLCSTIPA